MMKRLCALLCALVLAAAMLPAAVAEEEEPSATQDELDEARRMDEVDEDDEDGPVQGDVYHEPELREFNQSSPALYTALIKDNYSLFRERSIESAKLVTVSGNRRADILYVGVAWVVARWRQVIGYIKRDHISEVTPVDKQHTPPYGVQKAAYIATTATVCPVRKSMSLEDDSWVVLNPGTKLSIYQLQDGWAVVNYWRTYGYIPISELTDLIPVSPTDKPIRSDTPIAAYTTYYSMAQTEINLNRIINIAVACRRLTRVMASGERLNFNDQVGPYRAANGYMPAPVLINGETKPGYGGGTCQVSSTLYNALMQLPGITIIQRRPHGPSGAKYLPHGMDAAVGNAQLNLVFRNDYDFPIRVEGHTSDDGALLMVIYRVAQDS